MTGGSERAYEAIVKTATDGIVVIDEQGIVQSFNPAAERIFRYRADEIVGRNINMLMPAAHYGKHDEYLARYLRTGVAVVIGIGREVEGRRQDGSLVPLDLAVTEWSLNGRRFFTGIVRDLTFRKVFEQETTHALEVRDGLEKLVQNLEQRLCQETAEREAAQRTSVQAARLQALGELAGGIAHDFNNVLQAVSGAADLVRVQSDRPIKIMRQLDTIEHAVKRGSSIVNRLLAFARRSNLRARPLDVADILDDLRQLLAQTLGVSVTIRIEVEAALPLMMADKATLETVLINLATNARDAMPNGGVLTLSATRLVVGKGDRGRNGLNSGRYIKITAADTGVGMNEATLARATDPFFTTKPQDNGSFSQRYGSVPRQGREESRKRGGRAPKRADQVGQGTAVGAPREVKREARPDPDKPGWGRTISL